jgi:hypothetical protein
MNDQNVNSDEMYRRARRGWFFALFGFIFQIAVAYFMMRSLMSSPGMSRPFVVVDDSVIVYVGIPLAIAIFIGGLILKVRFTRRGIDEQNRQLVQKGFIYGAQASALLGTIGVALAVLCWYPYFFLWCIFGIVSLMFHFPRPQPFFDVVIGNSESAQQKSRRTQQNTRRLPADKASAYHHHCLQLIALLFREVLDQAPIGEIVFGGIGP